MNFDKQTIVVIGGSSGIGLATAMAAHEASANVVIGSRSKDKREGRIALFREYYNPIVLSEAFGNPSELARGFSLT